MKKGLLVMICTFWIISSFTQKVDTLDITSKIFADKRQVVVYIPEYYEVDSNEYAEVIYVLDAQNHYSSEQVFSTSSFMNKGFFSPIVVGIISKDRGKDFLPKNQFAETYTKREGHLGDADKLIHFLSDEVIPLITKSYRTLPIKAIVGHSLGGTFVSYCFLQNPNLFNGYIAISPNFAYDKEQFVKRFDACNTKDIVENKFFYMCNANEEIGFSEAWKIAREKVIARMNNKDMASKVTFTNEDFSKTDDHSTVYPKGVANGLKLFFDYYHNADKLMQVYETEYKAGRYHLIAEGANALAYSFLWNHKPGEAIKAILWANRLFPDDLNIYDSMGEIYQEAKDTANALQSFHLFTKKLEQQKHKLTPEKYKELKAGVDQRLKNISPKR